jgi:hypothetical protein
MNSLANLIAIFQINEIQESQHGKFKKRNILNLNKVKYCI